MGGSATTGVATVPRGDVRDGLRAPAELRPCPFCRGDRVSISASIITCVGCGALVRFVGASGDATIHAWNSR